ncbi:ferredoxin [Streptomyces sp. TRM49041]|uniref:ferredoxin n=1 Tax=Streptomyces sp. TRM49041 TaxID=2603216 RepID=UPI0011ED918F|nr:ferredoxin [Streptomyces sp. TRM49041]
MGDRWHIEVDRALCIGSGMCVHHAPDGFALDTARQSRPRPAETDPDARVLAAAEGCPVEAITITLHGTGQVVFPAD